MSEEASNKIEKGDLIYALIGGGIGFIVIYLTNSIVFDPTGIGAVYWSLASLGILGVISFQEEFVLALALMQFGMVYLLGGFCGGLYTGHKVEENLKFVLAISGMLTFLIFIASAYFQGRIVNLSIINFLVTVILPVTGSLIGSYLGGYAITWSGKEEIEEEF